MRWPFKFTSKPRKGLKYKLMIAFSVMSLIPLLSCTYLISIHIFPNLQDIVDVSVVMLIAVMISVLGLSLAKGLINPVIDMAIEARLIASGEFDRKILVKQDDEVGNLGDSINAMTQRIKNNLDELRMYGQKTREINIEIHKKILALSSILQIGDVISSGSMDLDAVLEMAVQKASMVFDAGFGALYMLRIKEADFVAKFQYNLEEERLQDVVIKDSGSGPLGRAIESRTILIVDEGIKGSKAVEDFKKSYGLKNFLAIPIYSGRRNLGLLVVGNRLDGFKFKVDDIDLIKVFAKQITIAIENNILLKKAEELAIIDELTGLFNKNYILSRLEEEIKRAIFYQRPCSFIVFNIDNFRVYRESKGEISAEDALKKAAKLIKDNVPPMAKLGRIGGDEFAVLLPEKNKREAANIADDIRKKIELASLVKEGMMTFTVSAGVSENPIDGSTREELFKRAAEALQAAKLQGKNRVGV